jgi:1-acyl-sn-glycerol-3-phosphate acyltransferase
MRSILRFIQIVYNIYATLLFIIILLIVFPLVLCTLILPKKIRGNIIYSLCRFFIDIALLLLGIWHRNIYEVPHDHRKPLIFVFNHISYLDALIILKAIRKQPIRGLGKYEIAKIPLFGLIYSSAVIMVNRSDKADRARSVSDLKKAIQENISIILAPEGTFNETNKPLIDFFDGAFRIAIETKTPIKPLIFLDAYDRLSYKNLFSLTPGKSRVVFLEEFQVDHFDIADVPVLKTMVYQAMENALIKYNASWIKE